jgi:hypothetical protein
MRREIAAILITALSAAAAGHVGCRPLNLDDLSSDAGTDGDTNEDGLSLSDLDLSRISPILAHADPSSDAGTDEDTDGDGLSDLDETDLYGTSPILADTDGDGLSDHTEIVERAFDPANNPYRFNPRVADLPSLGIEFVSAPRVTIYMTDATGESRSFEAAYGQERSFGHTTTATPEESAPESDAGASPGLDAGGAGGHGGGEEIVLRYGAGGGPPEEEAITFSEEEARANAETLNLAESYERSHDIQSSNGALFIATVLENRSEVAFQVTNVVLSATLARESGELVPIGNLILDVVPFIGSYQPFSLGPGERSGPTNFVKDILTLETAELILREAPALLIQLAVYELTGPDGTPLAFDLPEVRSKTATVILDYAGRRDAEQYRVATNLVPSRPGVTARRALEDILRVPLEADGDVGLTAVRGVGAEASGGGRWTVEHAHDDGVDGVTTPYDPRVNSYDLSDIELRAGDVLRLAWVEE